MQMLLIIVFFGAFGGAGLPIAAGLGLVNAHDTNSQQTLVAEAATSEKPAPVVIATNVDNGG